MWMTLVFAALSSFWKTSFKVFWAPAVSLAASNFWNFLMAFLNASFWAMLVLRRRTLWRKAFLAEDVIGI